VKPSSAEVGHDEINSNKYRRRIIVKVKIIPIIMMMFLVASIGVFPAAHAQCPDDNGDPLIEVMKEPFCNEDTYPGVDIYSTNHENGYYPMGTKLYMWIKINVTAHEAVENAVVYDRLAAEWMVLGIYLNNRAMPDHPMEQFRGPFNYTFAYADVNAIYDETGDNTLAPHWGDDVFLNGGLVATLDKPKTEISFGGTISEDEFIILWTGKSNKVHFTWIIGDMEADETRTIFLVIRTDENPAGKQEYTSCGTYELNSGAVVKAIVDGRQVTDDTGSIFIQICDPCVDEADDDECPEPEPEPECPEETGGVVEEETGGVVEEETGGVVEEETGGVVEEETGGVSLMTKMVKTHVMWIRQMIQFRCSVLQILVLEL
jgi:hypothetical protein